MLKWLLILLKALTIVPAVVSMAKGETRVAGLADENKTWEKSTLSYRSQWIKARDERGVIAERFRNKEKAEESPETCICRGCRVLRANAHGYAKRMRGAIRRDIEAESA